ncbi:MAG: low affinity iron permease family protein [Actinomycetota bacterium]|nr:low affinity iron permease family protein [Actinomycetota bacterium]
MVGEGSGVARARQESTRSFFDRFAGRSADFVSRAPFFAACVLLVVWAPSYLLVDSFDTYQLLINTPTTIVTFLLVALLQNTQKRSEQAVQHKLNAVADGLADLMEHFAADESDPRSAKEDLASDVEDLRAAVGLEGEM